MLEEDAARDQLAVGATLDAEPDEARDLLRLQEIALGRRAQRIAVERDDALIALLGGRLIEGDREITLVEQRDRATDSCPAVASARRRTGRSRAARRLVVAHQQADDAALGLRLERHLAPRHS
jgi:hypothetical protein